MDATQGIEEGVFGAAYRKGLSEAEESKVKAYDMARVLDRCFREVTAASRGMVRLSLYSSDLTIEMRKRAEDTSYKTATLCDYYDKNNGTVMVDATICTSPAELSLVLQRVLSSEATGRKIANFFLDADLPVA